MVLSTVLINDLAILYDVSEEVVERSFKANDVPANSERIDPEIENLVALYVDYLTALSDAKESREYFKYTDGEESVDKSKVYDNYRRYAQDVYNAWRSARSEYRQQMRQGGFYKLRKRASWLDA